MTLKKILVIEEVEDDNSLRKAIHEKLALEGFDVLEAKNGEEGLTTALSEHPDLILLDIMMPKMDGEVMLEQLRTDMWGKDVPVIILTNLSYLQDAKSKDHANEYLIKSDTKLETVVEKIKKYLQE